MKRISESGFLLSRVHQLSGRVFSRLLKEHNIEEINPAQGRILFALWKKDRISIRELAERTSLGQSTLTSMLDRLEKNGFIKREPDGDDRRKILIVRTEKDKSLQEQYDRVSMEMAELCFKNFTQEEVVLFEDFLKRLLKNLS